MQNKKPISLTSKDFFVVLALAYLGGDPSHHENHRLSHWTFASLGEGLGMSASQVHSTIARLIASRLLVGKGLDSMVSRKVLMNFILYGARYAYPAVEGPVMRGFVTGVHSEVFDHGDLIVTAPSNSKADMPYVWPSPKGNARGPSIAPLCEAAVEVAQKHPYFHAALVAFDVLRLGKTREVEVAEQFFRRGLDWK